MSDDMYLYRQLSPSQQQAKLAERIRGGQPHHSPPHFESGYGYRIVTATCYEHRKNLNSAVRLEMFEAELLTTLYRYEHDCAAWCILPNHYHVLVRVLDMRQLSRQLGQLHGRMSRLWNQQDQRPGRRIWYRCQDRIMRSEDHYATTLNYIHNNPVKHGLVNRWREWPYSSIHWYWKNKGAAWLREIWQQFPVLNYGAGWDDFRLSFRL